MKYRIEIHDTISKTNFYLSNANQLFTHPGCSKWSKNWTTYKENSATLSLKNVRRILKFRQYIQSIDNMYNIYIYPVNI